MHINDHFGFIAGILENSLKTDFILGLFRLTASRGKTSTTVSQAPHNPEAENIAICFNPGKGAMSSVRKPSTLLNTLSLRAGRTCRRPDDGDQSSRKLSQR